jgi:uncharacterized membrane protein YidH (DUF202 family)
MMPVRVGPIQKSTENGHTGMRALIALAIYAVAFSLLILVAWRFRSSKQVIKSPKSVPTSSVIVAA